MAAAILSLVLTACSGGKETAAESSASQTSSSQTDKLNIYNWSDYVDPATLSAFENVGFNGLSVAFIAASSPIGCIFAGLLFGGLLYGGASLQSQVGAPTEIINIVIGIIVFFCALSYVIPQLMDRYARKSVRSAAEKNAVQNQKGAGDAE